MESEVPFEAPFTAALVEQDNSKLRKLQLNFPAEFQQLDVTAQGAAIAAYITVLHQQVRAVEDGSREQQGMLIVLQIAEQMLPHIQAGEMDLSQTIDVEVASGQPEEPVQTVLGQPLWHELNS